MLILDWCGAILVLCGIYKLGEKDPGAFIYLICGCILHTIVAFEYGLYGWMTLDILIILLDLRNYYRWKYDTVQET